MKKWIVFIMLMLFIPPVVCVGFHVINPEIPFGQGGGIDSHYMNRDILLEINGLYKSIDVEEYVLGVMAGVISPEYSAEALKVQAVLIRTNVLKEMEEKNTKDGADLSYEYFSLEDRKELWGKRHFEKWELKFERAVSTTAGKVIRREGSLIMAAYHEVSIGKTASAKEILDEEVPYLQSVESSQDVEAKNYMNIITYTYSEIQSLINSKNSEIEIIIEDSTENGFVKSVSVDGIIYTGSETAAMFDLPSNNYYVEKVDGGIRFVCLGKGNCLGLSQYGANAMAMEGEKMEEIISHYFQGVSVELVSGD